MQKYPQLAAKKGIHVVPTNRIISIRPLGYLAPIFVSLLSELREVDRHMEIERTRESINHTREHAGIFKVEQRPIIRKRHWFCV